MEKDLFDLDDAPQVPEDNQPVVEEEVEPESDSKTEEATPAEEEAAAEEAASGDPHDDDDDEKMKDEEGDDDDEEKSSSPSESKPVNVIEKDPYEFDRCLITIALALMPDDGNPEGRPVMLGVRNHQDEPLMGACRLSDLMPLPDPVQQLIDQLKADLPQRSERNARKLKEKEEQEAKLKAAREKGKKTPGIKPASAKAKKAGPASVNLFEMFDQ